MTDQERINLMQERIQLTQEYYLSWIWNEYCSELQFELAVQRGNPNPKQGQEIDFGVFKTGILLSRKEGIKNRIHQIDNILFGGLKLQEV